jgi:hypothetical protein
MRRMTLTRPLLAAALVAAALATVAPASAVQVCRSVPLSGRTLFSGCVNADSQEISVSCTIAQTLACAIDPIHP